jgi:hypothetical protein
MRITEKEYKCVQFKDSFYLGQVINDNANGQGVLCCDDMHMYVGGFKNNKFHGQGFLAFPFKGFLFAEFWEGKVNGDVFWVNERMNYSKGNLSDKSEGTRFVSANAKGISNVNFGMNYGSKMVNKMKQRIGKKDLGLLNKGTQNTLRTMGTGDENGDLVGELPQASKNSLGTETSFGSTVKFSEKRFHTKKFVQNVKTPKNIMRYLKTMCLMSKEYYPEKDKHNKTRKFTSEMDRFRDTLQNLENVNNFEKNHYYMKNRILEKTSFNGQSDIGTVFLPWGSFGNGFFLRENGKYFGRMQYMNGDFEWGFFKQAFFHLNEDFYETGGVHRTEEGEIFLETDDQEQRHVRLHGFGSRFYREKGLMVTGFFQEGTLHGNYLLDFVENDSFKFSLFENNELKKDYFFCEKMFDYSKMNSHLRMYMLNRMSSEYISRRVKIESDVFVGKLQKTQHTNSIRKQASKARAKKAMEFKEMQGRTMKQTNRSHQIFQGSFSWGGIG